MIRSIKLALISAINIGLLFIFQFYIITQLGPTIETDALFAGMTLPQIILTVVSSSLMHVLVPIFIGKSDKELNNETWNIIYLIGGGGALLTILFSLSALWWVPLIVPGFDEATKNLTIELTRIQLISMVFSGINAVQWAFYHSKQQFIWLEMVSVFANAIALLLLIFVLPYYGVIGAAWIMVLRLLLQTLFLIPRMPFPSSINLKSPSILQIWCKIKPLLFGTAYYKTEPLIDRFLLSSATLGSLSLYYLAQQIYSAINRIINKAIVAPLVPKLSKLDKASDFYGFRCAYLSGILQVASVSLICFLTVYIIGRPLLELLVGYGNFKLSDVNDLWWIMIWLGGVLIGGALGQITSSAFYSYGETKIPTLITMLTYTLYIPSKIVAFYFFSVKGLAIATTIYYIGNFIIQILFLERDLRNDT